MAQEFESIGSPTASYLDGVSASVATLNNQVDFLLGRTVNLTTVEALLQLLVTGQVLTNAQLNTAVLELIDKTTDELMLKELKKIHLQLADMTDNFIEDVD